jgi:hypothetical protein
LKGQRGEPGIQKVEDAVSSILDHGSAQRIDDPHPRINRRVEPVLAALEVMNGVLRHSVEVPHSMGRQSPGALDQRTESLFGKSPSRLFFPSSPGEDEGFGVEPHGTRFERFRETRNQGGKADDPDDAAGRCGTIDSARRRFRVETEPAGRVRNESEGCLSRRRRFHESGEEVSVSVIR